MLFDLSVVADTAFYSLDRSVHITAEVTNQCKDNTFSSGCCFVEIEVDIPLGLVTVKDIINVHDSGILINPLTARAQVHGGMSMGLGYGLSEELLVDEKTGRPLNNNLLDYKIPTAMDTPDLNVAFIELETPPALTNKSWGETPCHSGGPGHPQCHLKRHRSPDGCDSHDRSAAHRKIQRKRSDIRRRVYV